MRLTGRRLLTALALGPLLGLLVALPASAAPILNERYSGTESFTECGFQGESGFSGRVMIKDATPATDGQFFYFQDTTSGCPARTPGSRRPSISARC